MSETPNIEALEAIAEEQARRAASLPVHEQIIIKSTIRHLINGAYWGFDTDIETRLSRVSEDLQKAGSKDAIVWNLRRGGIVEVKSFETAVTIMRKAVGIEGFSNEMCEKAMKRTEQDLLELLEFCRAGKSGTVGFYNTNKSDAIIVNGVSLPAYRLNAHNFLGVLAREGYSVQTAKGTKATAEQALSGVRNFIAELDKAPSSNAVLVRIGK